VSALHSVFLWRLVMCDLILLSWDIYILCTLSESLGCGFVSFLLMTEREEGDGYAGGAVVRSLDVFKYARWGCYVVVVDRDSMDVRGSARL